MPLGLTVQFKGDNSQLAATIGNTQRRVMNLAASFGQFLKGAVVLRALDAAFRLVGSPIEGFKKAIDMGGELNDLSSQTGATARDLMIMRQAFADTKAGAEKVGPSINKLQKALTGVNEEGQPTNKAFAALGLNIDRLRKQSAPEQFQAIGKAMRELRDPAARSAAAMQIFGKSGGELLSVFSDAGAFGSAAQTLGTQADIMSRNTKLFDAVGDILGHAGTKFQGFFVGIADKVAPVLLPILEKMDKMDFAKWGQQIGEAVAIIVEIFQSGQISEMLGLALKIGAEEGMNFLTAALRGALTALPTYLSESVGLFIDGIGLIMRPQFWTGLANALVGAAMKFGAYLLNVASEPIILLQTGFEWVATQFSNLLSKAMEGPISYLQAGAGYFIQEILNGILKIPGMKKILGIDEAHQSFEEMQAEASRQAAARSPGADNRSLEEMYAGQKGKGASMFGMNSDEMNKRGDASLSQAGTDLAPILQDRLAQFAKATQAVSGKFMEGFNGPKTFDTTGSKDTISDFVSHMRANVDAKRAKADENAEGGGFDNARKAIDKKPGEDTSKGGGRGGAISSALARVGGGGGYAGGGPVLNQMEKHLRKIVTNTQAKPLNSGGLQGSAKLKIFSLSSPG